MNADAAGHDTAATAVSALEEQDLTFIRQEEKLARDLYQLAGATWNLSVFNNIPSSESQHMAAVGGLLQSHGIADPVANLAAGAFVDPGLTTLYAELAMQATASELAALDMGATVEEYDIVDIRERRTHTSLADLQAVYDQLLLGSRNHLRAFDAQLRARGASHTAGFLTQAEYDAIAASAKESAQESAGGAP